MRVGFYIPAFEHLGISYLSAVLEQAGHETVGFMDPLLCKEGAFHTKSLERLLDMESYVVDQIVNSDVDLLAFSVVTNNFIHACRVARSVKAQRDIPTVFGGIHCSSVPHRVVEKPEIDYVVVGEGEGAMVDLAGHLDAGETKAEIPNIWLKDGDRVVSSAPRHVIEDLDSLPFPNKDVFYAAAPSFLQRHYMTTASRGCCFACSYCNNSRMRRVYEGKGRWRRRRSVDNLMAELLQAQEKYSFTDIRFWDEVFIDDRDWLEEFAEKYPPAIGKPFFCWGHARFIDEDVVATLEKAGCQELNIGVEAVQEETRRELLRRTDTTDEIIEAFDLVRPTRMWLSTGNIVALPGQTVEDVAEMAAFYNEHRVDRTWVFFFRYYPNTAIVDLALEQGYLTPEDAENLEDPPERAVSISRSNKSDNQDMVRLATVIYLTSLLPKGLVARILKNDRWRWIPAFNLQPFIAIAAAFLKRIRFGKRPTVEGYSTSRYVQAMIQYGARKAAWKLRRRFRGSPRRDA
ncbi:MAG: B12-binding domain-containing radical SAM protein [Candidatus Hydrogenedentes bacterium]|nr:B12-binding domain-containing radical SAM protein [Candidatus Hydrogenedentota bacterium]